MILLLFALLSGTYLIFNKTDAGGIGGTGIAISIGYRNLT